MLPTSKKNRTFEVDNSGLLARHFYYWKKKRMLAWLGEVGVVARGRK